MLSYGSSARLAAVASACALCAVAAPAFADAPAMSLTVNSGMSGKYFEINPTTVHDGVGSYNGFVLGMADSWRLDYQMSGGVDGASGAQSGTLSLSNLTGTAQTYSITLALPTTVSGDYLGFFNGSVSATLITGGAGGSMTSAGGLPLWTASSAGVVAGELFADPFTVSRGSAGATSLGSQSFGGNSPSSPTDAFGGALAITLNFTLSANSTASFTSAFAGFGVPVPAPGALALLGFTGLAARRRRR